MDTRLTAAAFAACFAIATAAHAQLEVVGGRTPTNRGDVTSPHNLDAMYDYDLYLALPETATGWFIEYVYSDGFTRTRGPFKTERDAKIEAERDTIYAAYVRDGEVPSKTFIYEGLSEPNWQYFGTYATRAEAEAEALYFEEIGMLTDIRRVSTLQLELR